MTHIEFADKLCQVPLEKDLYRKLGCSESLITDNERRACFIEKADFKNLAGNSDDPIENLVNTYDVANVEIGMVRFNQKVNHRHDYALFGKFEMDDLAINSITKEVILLEEGIRHILLYCAANSSAFLTALLCMAAFLEKRGVDNSLFENEFVQKQFAIACADVAGGEKYVDFYNLMLGV